MNQPLANDFPWLAVPWENGPSKYRLGLRPLDVDCWFSGTPGGDLAEHKHRLLTCDYANVVQTLPESAVAQRLLAQHMIDFGLITQQVKDNTQWPDLIAELACHVADDLCLMETKKQPRLVAACVCSPSYWNIREKIGLSMAAIHQPVVSLEEKIGSSIQRVLTQSPLLKPFERSNWFMHSDRQRKHLRAENPLDTPPNQWFVRSERETICRFSEDYALFTINVRFAPLKEIASYPVARADLSAALSKFDADEITYFGGRKKYQQLCAYINSLDNNS